MQLLCKYKARLRNVFKHQASHFPCIITSKMFSFLFTAAALVSFGSAQRVPSTPNSYNVRFSSDVNLTFAVSGRALPNGGLKSIDPYIKLYSTTTKETTPVKFATSDVVTNSADPDFISTFAFVWKRGTGQTWIFKVKDSRTFSDATLGEAIVDVDQYVLGGEKKNVSLSKDVGGSLFIQKTTPIRFRLYARQLPKLDFPSGKSDPFVKISWQRGSNGEEHNLAKTQVIDNVENADWNETFEFPGYIKGKDFYLKFKVRDYDGIGKDDDLGETLLEVDPFVEKRQTKIVSIGKTGKATLGITPAY